MKFLRQLSHILLIMISFKCSQVQAGPIDHIKDPLLQTIQNQILIKNYDILPYLAFPAAFVSVILLHGSLALTLSNLDELEHHNKISPKSNRLFKAAVITSTGVITIKWLSYLSEKFEQLKKHETPL